MWSVAVMAKQASQPLNGHIRQVHVPKRYVTNAPPGDASSPQPSIAVPLVLDDQEDLAGAEGHAAPRRSNLHRQWPKSDSEACKIAPAMANRERHNGEKWWAAKV